MESEQERLTRMYTELSDEHLQDLAADRDSLTPTAELALRHVLTDRGLTAAPVADAAEPAEEGEELEAGFTPGIPGMFPSSAAVMEMALEPGGTEQAGMVNLMTFFDGHELTRACTALEEAGIDLVIEPLTRDALAGAPPSFRLWVPTEDKTPAEDLLRARLGLFPLAELSDDNDAEMTAEDFGIVASFETTEEAEQARLLLAGHSIRARVEVDDGDGFETWYTVVVDPADRERALELVTEAMNAA